MKNDKWLVSIVNGQKQLHVFNVQIAVYEYGAEATKFEYMIVAFLRGSYTKWNLFSPIMNDDNRIEYKIPRFLYNKKQTDIYNGNKNTVIYPGFFQIIGCPFFEITEIRKKIMNIIACLEVSQNFKKDILCRSDSHFLTKMINSTFQ